MSLLSMRDVTVEYGAGRRAIKAVDDVSLDVPADGIVGLVGESGSGKSTLAKAIVGLASLTRGAITLDRAPITGSGRDARERRRRVQMVFQDPYSSLDPRMTVGDSMIEALTVGRRLNRAQRGAEIARLLDLVSIDPAVEASLPRQLSGGQLQRVSIARALAADPRLLIADEITSSLDVSVQGAILNVVRDIKASLGLTMLFISHNVAVVRYISDTIAVMYLGQIVEVGPTDDVLTNPRHPYTKVLLDSVPGTDAVNSDETRLVDGDPPDPHDPPPGCRFHPRCPVGPRGARGADDLRDRGSTPCCAEPGQPGSLPLRRRAPAGVNADLGGHRCARRGARPPDEDLNRRPRTLTGPAARRIPARPLRRCHPRRRRRTRAACRWAGVVGQKRCLTSGLIVLPMVLRGRASTNTYRDGTLAGARCSLPHARNDSASSVAPGARHDGDAHPLTPLRVFDADDGAVGDTGMACGTPPRPPARTPSRRRS